MNNNLPKIGQNKAVFESKEVTGELVDFKGEQYYKISEVDAMQSFFMSIVSASNHWMFIASNGGVSAGRKNSDNALFPYYTDDKITEGAEFTGSKTIIKASTNDDTFLWEPLSDRYNGIYQLSRHLYKNKYGNKVVFEETNHDLQLTYRYHWNTSDKYGFIKKAEIINHGEQKVTCDVLDGLQNILPASVGEDLQKAYSNLVDAYKRSELHQPSGVGMIALSAVIVDKAEPSEALKASICWSLGLDNPTYLLSSKQLHNFRKGIGLEQETDVKASRGAYFVNAQFELNAHQEKEYWFIADVIKSIGDVIAIADEKKNNPKLKQTIQDSIDAGTKKLISLVAASDGLQLTDDPLTNNRHFSNTMFNIMRGGIFDDNYNIERADFTNYLKSANKSVYAQVKEALTGLSEVFTLKELQSLVDQANDADFKRLCLEYLPLKFSRRHGDPSRPWNKFSINTRNEVDGSKILDYEGNWRDIFQNWEALAHSYPEFMEGMIFKFLNATTFDGYNPYRVTKGGFDWEVIEEDDPWSYIGYWGDHQIIYLLKFLEFQQDYHPGELANYLTDELFVYANVPYVIKSYEDICKNPKDTIDFDHRTQEKIEEQRAATGADGALLTVGTDIYKINFLEKILATVLAKVSNFIPEAGIWLNTQRPEWNDANNALVGNGVSMVTLYYLRRFLDFFGQIINDAQVHEVQLSSELVSCFNAMHAALTNHQVVLENGIDNKTRKAILDQLGKPASDYRQRIYKNGFSGEKKTVSIQTIQEFVKITQAFLEHSITANKREDDLYHAYNLMTIKEDEVHVSYLSEMLEGQVAVLSSGYLTPQQSLAVMDGLKNSVLFRPDQYSYILYPNKELKGFEEKNNIPEALVNSSALLQQLVKDGNKQVITRDINGDYHFNASFNNVNSLTAALEDLDDNYQDAVQREHKTLKEIFEKVFNHKAFTGRSGTFFGYEGLGSIYWHMVSKLLLAVQETVLRAIDEGASDETVGRMLEHYYEIQAGIGVHKSPKLYGAFPTDAYSHTPATKGAQQPGMTGQVKEDILCRIGELGVKVSDGKVRFEPELLREQEFLSHPDSFHYIDVNGNDHQLELAPGSLAFTYCQVPVVYRKAASAGISIHLANSEVINQDNNQLSLDNSNAIFQRTGEIQQVVVSINEGLK